ncbi:unnamed protein product [Leptidea sinapis]|uniref:Uncharacterized protein n=1 Tax=Leptidea sinapis TaxID=189913 RepID=A0A5E4R5A2_9NEOP|nr:unnamed protein product [Leptidea sinapis]
MCEADLIVCYVMIDTRPDVYTRYERDEPPRAAECQRARVRPARSHHAPAPADTPAPTRDPPLPTQ